MKNLNNLVKAALLLLLGSIDLAASDRFGYTVNLPQKKTSIIITCKDTDNRIIQDLGFKGLMKPMAEVVAGSIDRFSKDRTYLVFVRISNGKIYCHVDEEPIGEHPVVNDFSFSSGQWKSRFIEKVFSGILGSSELPRKSVKLHKGKQVAGAQCMNIELGPVPGQSLESWSICW